MDKGRVHGGELFPRVKKGDVPSASNQNKVHSVLERLTRMETVTQHRDARLALFKLNEVLGDADNTGKGFAHDRKGVLQYWDNEEHVTDDVEDYTDPDQTLKKTTLSDPFGLVYDRYEKYIAWYCEQAGQHFPLNPRTVRHAITWPQTADDSEGCGTITDSTYPVAVDGDVPTKYPIKFVRMPYSESGSAYQNATISYLFPRQCHDGFVYNLGPPSYLPPYTPIMVYNVNNQWYTFVCCEFEDVSSSSSSSLSSSSSSSQSSSSSSNSSSSLSSSSSVSRSESSSSSDRSSSSASSNSSSSQSSSSDSSQSISESSGWNCVDVVVSLSFDPESCVLTYSTRQICFPLDLGVIIGPVVT